MHPPHESYPDASAYSDAQWGRYLVRSEWYRLQLVLDLREGDIADVPDTDLRTMFHGTEWGSAYRIVRERAFIVGSGTHSIRGRSKSGCWCVPTLPDALERADPRRYKYDGNFSRLSCPVVLELKVADLVRVPRSSMHCAPGGIGQIHRGLVIDAIHFNIRLMDNYLKLELADIKTILATNTHCSRICACGLCGQYTSPADPNWWGWQKSGQGHYYHPRCHSRITAQGSSWF